MISTSSKSNTPSNITSLTNTSISHYSLKNHINPNFNNKQNIKNFITFTTLNTRGLNASAKLNTLANSVDNRSIFLCTETKLKQDNHYPKNINGRSLIYG